MILCGWELVHQWKRILYVLIYHLLINLLFARAQCYCGCVISYCTLPCFVYPSSIHNLGFDIMGYWIFGIY